jgi:hypothetical protein
MTNQQTSICLTCQRAIPVPNGIGAVTDYFDATTNSLTTISGGVISAPLVLNSSARVIFEGSNFAVNGAPAAYGTILAGSGRITGTLLDGNTLSTQFQISDNASIVLVPEPATLLILDLGGIMLKRMRGEQRL